MTAATLPNERWRLGYRPALDGVRGVAIIAVMGYHFFVPGFAAGGYVGVTMFFVLSGYLITALMKEERARTGRLSVRNFYLRRVRRLIPALVVLVALVLILAAARGRIAEVGPMAASVLLYVGNVAQLGDPISLEHLSHTWSLAVEEQFYLVWPWVFILVAGRAWVAAVAVGAAATLARMSGWDLAGLERADALMIGCALALGASRVPWVSMPAGLGSLAALAVVTVVPIPTPILLTVVAVLTAMVIQAVAAPGLVTSLLSLKPLVFVGRISYGLYLWHFAVGWEVWPTLAAWHWLPAAVVLSAISFGFALASWRYVEQPLLRRSGAPKRYLARTDASTGGTWPPPTGGTARP